MAIPVNCKFTISDAYVKTPNDIAEIEIDRRSRKKWENGFTNFKANIRAHLKRKQNNKCALCRCRISIGTSYSNLEHLVPKTQYPQFEFKEDNLVYACHRCNFSKTKLNTLSNPVKNKSTQVFPINSQGFNIVNPYYDNYEDHIDFLDDVIVVNINNSTKGANTIKFYKLFRPELAEERAFIQKLDQSNINTQLVFRLLDTTLNQNVIDQINNVIDNLPTWVLEE